MEERYVKVVIDNLANFLSTLVLRTIPSFSPLPTWFQLDISAKSDSVSLSQRCLKVINLTIVGF